MGLTRRPAAIGLILRAVGPWGCCEGGHPARRAGLVWRWAVGPGDASASTIGLDAEVFGVAQEILLVLAFPAAVAPADLKGFGCLRGKIAMMPDFDEPLAD